MYNPGQFAVLTKGMSKVAQQDMNIGGLWTDEPVLTGRELHEARRESTLTRPCRTRFGWLTAVARSQQ